MAVGPVMQWLNSQLNQRYQWQAAKGFTWLAQDAINREGHIPDTFRTEGIACFEIPLIAANLKDQISAKTVAHLSAEATANGKNTALDIWAPNGVSRYYYGPYLRKIMFLGGWPQRGDLIYFWAYGVGYYAHVAVATGNRSEVISFGHYEDGRNDTDLNRTLETKTIEEIIDSHAQHRRHLTEFSAVYYGPPPWR